MMRAVLKFWVENGVISFTYMQTRGKQTKQLLLWNFREFFEKYLSDFH